MYIQHLETNRSDGIVMHCARRSVESYGFEVIIRDNKNGSDNNSLAVDLNLGSIFIHLNKRQKLMNNKTNHDLHKTS